MILLPARPANAGAHRLAWWVAERGDRLRRLCGRADLSAQSIQRMIRGEIAPAEEVAVRIAEATGGAVRPEDWAGPADRAWGDRPAERAPCDRRQADRRRRRGR